MEPAKLLRLTRHEETPLFFQYFTERLRQNTAEKNMTTPVPWHFFFLSPGPRCHSYILPRGEGKVKTNSRFYLEHYSNILTKHNYVEHLSRFHSANIYREPLRTSIRAACGAWGVPQAWRTPGWSPDAHVSRIRTELIPNRVAGSLVCLSFSIAQFLSLSFWPCCLHSSSEPDSGSAMGRMSLLRGAQGKPRGEQRGNPAEGDMEGPPEEGTRGRGAERGAAGSRIQGAAPAEAATRQGPARSHSCAQPGVPCGRQKITLLPPSKSSGWANDPVDMRRINGKCPNSSRTCVRGRKCTRPGTRGHLRLTCHPRARGAGSGVSEGKRPGHRRAGKGQHAVSEFSLGHRKQRGTAGRPWRLRCPSPSPPSVAL